MIIALVSCYTTRYVPINDEMNTWVGHTEHDLILSKGAPSISSDDGDGGKVLSYRQTNYTTVATPASYTNNGFINPSIARTNENTTYMDFYVNSSGVIYNWRTNIQKEERKDNPTGTTILEVGGVVGLAFLVIQIFK